MLVDVTERTIKERIDYIADWLEATGGLNAAKSPPNPKRSLHAVKGLQFEVGG